MEKKSIVRNYLFLAVMLGAMVLGAIAGRIWPATETSAGATVLKPLGTVFINMMFCIVVPMVFASISSAVASMESRKRAGKIMGVTVGTFVVTGAIAAVIMYVLMMVFPPVLTAWTELPAGELGEYASLSDLIVNFFTASDFVGLLTRRAMLPLIVFSLLFGFSVNLSGGKDSLVARFLEDLTNVMLKFVKIITYYAPVALGTCSSVATIPTNMEEAADTGISKDVADMVLPLGATMHMDGSCFSCVLKIAFVLGVFGQRLTPGMLVPVILVAVLSSVGMSGVPGGGYIGEYIICSIFFPTQMEIAFPILVVIGNLVDPPATMINAAGDYVVCYVVSRLVDGKDWLQKQLKR